MSHKPAVLLRDVYVYYLFMDGVDASEVASRVGLSRCSVCQIINTIERRMRSRYGFPKRTCAEYFGPNLARGEEGPWEGREFEIHDGDKPDHRFLRRREVESRTGLSRSTIYLAMSRGNFPKPVKLGERAVGWLESDIDAWISSRIDPTPAKG